MLSKGNRYGFLGESVLLDRRTSLLGGDEDDGSTSESVALPYTLNFCTYLRFHHQNPPTAHLALQPTTTTRLLDVCRNL